jgi:CubicO group peptidase (beta-lactamase class C family)
LLHLPGLAVGVALGDSLIFFKGMGTANPSTNEPLTADHIFPIASVTKSFTAIALKQMEGEGKLSLNDPISKYPNQYFTPARWNQQTTLGQLISQTAESAPPGSQFVYNGSKFNIVFNAFSAINKTNIPNDITRPFTDEIQKRILTPLKMEHTLLRFSENEHGYLKKWIAPVYRLNDADGKFTPLDVNLLNMQSGPGFGMMSSVNDLVRYSAALGQHKLLTECNTGRLPLLFTRAVPMAPGGSPPGSKKRSYTGSMDTVVMMQPYYYGYHPTILR